MDAIVFIAVIDAVILISAIITMTLFKAFDAESKAVCDIIPLEFLGRCVRCDDHVTVANII